MLLSEHLLLYSIAYLVLLEENSLVFLLLADLLVVGQLLGDLLCDGGLPLYGNFVFEDMLGVLVGKGQQPGGYEGAHREHDGVCRHVNGVNPPVEPNRNDRDDEGVAVEEGARLSGHILVESLQQQLLLPRHLGPRLGCHFAV